jgi:hypothetical protein
MLQQNDVVTIEEHSVKVSRFRRISLYIWMLISYTHMSHSVTYTHTDARTRLCLLHNLELIEH